jgi:hypothetical protein
LAVNKNVTDVGPKLSYAGVYEKSVISTRSPLLPGIVTEASCS